MRSEREIKEKGLVQEAHKRIYYPKRHNESGLNSHTKHINFKPENIISSNVYFISLFLAKLNFQQKKKKP